jgi:hypothetical protein
MAKVRNPLEPLSTAVTAVVTLIAILIGTTLLAALFTDHTAVLGIGDKSVCATDTTKTTSVDEQTAPSSFQPAPGAILMLDAHPRYCTAAPSTIQSLLNTATRLASFVFTVGALLLVLRLIRGAERDGLYTTRTARRLRGLGWWLLAGSVLAAIAASTAEKALAASLSLDSGILTLSGLWMWDVPFMAIFTGLGILSFARIMRIGIRMREDLVGTV